MAIAQDTITRALRLIGVIEAGETPSAEDATDALATLNEMLHGWAKEGVDIQHITLALTDTFKVHDSWLRGIRYNLAVEIAPEYGAAVSARVDEIADATFKAFQAHTFEFDDDLRIDRALDPRYFSRRTGAYNIDEA